MKRIQVASLQKRILSSLIDLTLIVGFTCLFHFCVFGKIVSSVQHFDQLENTIRDERINSGLYDQTDSRKTILEKNPKLEEKDLEPILKTFYVDFLSKKYPSEDPKKQMDTYWYHTHILYLDDYSKRYEGESIDYPQVRLFDWNEAKTEYVHKPDTTDEQANEFFHQAFGTAVTELTLTNPIKQAKVTMTWGNLRSILYSSLFTTFVLCFVIPISLKNGKTIGKLITKLVVLTDEGYEYQRYKHIFRYLSFYIIEVFGAFVSIGLTLIFSTSLALFTKKRRALHDFIAFSVVADETYSVFYKNEQEESEYELKSEAKLTA